MRVVRAICILSIITSSVLIAQTPVNNESAMGPLLQRRLEKLDHRQKTKVVISLRGKIDLKSFKRLGKGNKGKIAAALKDRAKQDEKYIRRLLKQQGVTDVRSLWISNSLAVSVKPAVIRLLAQLPEVEAIQLDKVITLGVEPIGHFGASQWHLDAVEVPFLWSLGFDGTGIVVANMDTGVDIHHPDLAGRWRGGNNSWKDVFGQHPLPYDYDGHGTATMGIIVGGDYGGTSIGVAPGAKWIAVKIFDDNGNTSYSKIHEGFQWLLDPDGDPNTPDAPDVVNNSWGLHTAVNECIDEFSLDIETLKAAGIAMVFAAGNAGPSEATSVSPANNPFNLSVGATDEASVIANFSSRGPSPCSAGIFPTLSAPGMNIKTADLTADGVIPNSYTFASGTSAASAVVSGSMALLLCAFPEMELNQLEKTLILSSSDAGQTGPDYLYGNGIINVAVAYEFAASLCPEDFEKDYEVGFSDLMIFMAQWLEQDCVQCRADLNNDQIVNMLDFAMFSEVYGKKPCLSISTGDVD